jgi:antitoxin (DNA-binding transcriptional repressor) of toxin-antitoxin stability system
MRKIEALDAEASLERLLDDVERGETIVIMRSGRSIARIVPEALRRQQEIDEAIEGIRALRAQIGKVTVEEIISSKHEGHKY